MMKKLTLYFLSTSKAINLSRFFRYKVRGQSSQRTLRGQRLLCVTTRLAVESASVTNNNIALNYRGYSEHDQTVRP